MLAFALSFWYRSTNPWTSKSTLARNNEAGVCLLYYGVNNIDSILVNKSGIRSFPGSYTPSAISQSDGCFFDPACSKSVEEIGLAGHLRAVSSLKYFPSSLDRASYLAAVHVSVAKLSYIYLDGRF